MSKHAEPFVNRKHASRREREALIRKRLIMGTAAVFVLVGLVLVWGLYDQFVRRPALPVATVGGETIRVDTYQRLLQYRRWDYGNYLNQLQAQRQQIAAGGEEQAFLLQYIDQQIQQIQTESMSLSVTTVDDLIDDKLIRQEASRRGIVVSEADVDERLEQQFGYQRNPPTPVPTPITTTEVLTPTPTVAPMTFEEFQTDSNEWFTTVEDATGFKRTDFRNLIEGSVYREKVTEAIQAEAPTTGEQVQARHILVATQEEAQAVLDRLAAGEAFADLAAELSTDESNKDNGGDLGWFGRGMMVAEFETEAFALQPGETSGIVETSFGFHIIQLVERDPNRPLEGSELQAAQQEYFDNWLETQRNSETVERFFASSMVPTVIPTKPFRAQ